MRQRWDKHALGWRYILYWPTGYWMLWLCCIAVMGGGLSYLFYFHQFYQQYQSIQWEYNHQARQLMQQQQNLQQMSYYQQLLKQQRQTFMPLITLNEQNASMALAQIYQLSEQHGISILQLQQQQNNPWRVDLDIRMDFEIFLNFLQGFIQLPYALQITEITLMQDPSAINRQSLIGKMTLEAYTYE